MSVSGSFTVAGPLISFNGDLQGQLLTYSFLDGVYTLTPANFTGSFLVATDSGGNIVNWLIDLSSQNLIDTSLRPGDQVNRIVTRPSPGLDFPQVYKCDFVVVSCVYSLVGQAQTSESGSWHIASVPEPTTLTLALLGVVALSGMAIRGRK